MVKLCQAVALTLFLLLAQQGAVQHAMLAHASASPRQEPDDRHGAAGERCELCAAFAQVAVVLAADDFVPALLAGVAFGLPAVAPADACIAEPPATRSRGPPAGA